MPLTPSAIKKLKRDRKIFIEHETVRTNLRKVLKTARATPTAKSIASASRALDKAVKGSIIHKNRAARLKSRLAKRLKKK